MQSSTVRFWTREWWKALKSWRWRRACDIFNRTMTPNTPQNGPKSGLKTMILRLRVPLRDSFFYPEPSTENLPSKVSEFTTIYGSGYARQFPYTLSRDFERSLKSNPCTHGSYF